MKYLCNPGNPLVIQKPRESISCIELVKKKLKMFSLKINLYIK